MGVRWKHGRRRVEAADPVDTAGRSPDPDREFITHLQQVSVRLDEVAALLTAGHDGELLAYDGAMLAKTVHEAGDLLGTVAAALRFRAEMGGPR